MNFCPLLICMRCYCLLAACIPFQNKHISAARHFVQLFTIFLRVWNVIELISHLCLCWQKSCQAGSWTWPRWPSQRSVKSRSFRRSWRPSTSCWGPTVGPSSGMWTVSITSTSVTSMLKLTLQQLSSALEINWMKLPVYNMGQSILDKWIALFSMTFGYFYLPLDYPSHLNANFFPLTLHLHIGRTS